MSCNANSLLAQAASNGYFTDPGLLEIILTQLTCDVAGALAVPTNQPKVYRALLTQSGTDVPVATALENSLGGTVVWTRASDGNYSGTLSGAFTANKTFILTPTWPAGIAIDSGPVFVSCVRASNNAVNMLTGDPNSGFVDPAFVNHSVEILVYP